MAMMTTISRTSPFTSRSGPMRIRRRRRQSSPSEKKMPTEDSGSMLLLVYVFLASQTMTDVFKEESDLASSRSLSFHFSCLRSHVRVLAGHPQSSLLSCSETCSHFYIRLVTRKVLHSYVLVCSLCILTRSYDFILLYTFATFSA